MKEEDFREEVELIKEDISEFKAPYSSCQYFHERGKRFSKDQLVIAVKLFHRTMEEKFSRKD